MLKNKGGESVAYFEQPGAPDCGTCWQRDQCPNAQAGEFCPRWQSTKPAAREPDPNDLWRQGEDVGF